MKWIKHDTDANQDAKLQNVLLDYGLEGYGLYWYCIELIASKVDKDNITFELEHDARIIARNTGCTVQKTEEMMRYFVDVGLFENSTGTITCMKLAKRLDKSMTSNPVMRELIQDIKSHDGIMTESESIMQDKIRLDKTRLDKSIKTLRVCDEVEDEKPKKRVKQTPYKKIVDLYHEILPNNPEVRLLDDPTRKRQIRNLHKERLPELENWKKYFDYIASSDFLTGRVIPEDGRKPFRPNIDWLTTPKSYKNIFEGKYHG